MFYNCQSLVKIPDISKWNSTNVSNIEDLFSGCKSLTLPNISKWKNHNIQKTNFSFYEPTSISNFSIPIINSSFNSSNYNNINSIMESNLENSEFKEENSNNSKEEFSSYDHTLDEYYDNFYS